MERRIQRTYAFNDREIREALIAWLKSKDMQAPSYVGDTPDTKWTKESAGLRVEWFEADEVLT